MRRRLCLSVLFDLAFLSVLHFVWPCPPVCSTVCLTVPSRLFHSLSDCTFLSVPQYAEILIMSSCLFHSLSNHPSPLFRSLSCLRGSGKPARQKKGGGGRERSITPSEEAERRGSNTSSSVPGAAASSGVPGELKKAPGEYRTRQEGIFVY